MRIGQAIPPCYRFWVFLFVAGCATPPATTSVVDAAMVADLVAPGGCWVARGCASGVCEVDAGLCVECVMDADCPLKTRPACDISLHQCRECVAAADPAHDLCPAARFCD